MTHERIYPNKKENVYFDTYIIDDPLNKGRKKPIIVICPGGAYQGLSEREAEPIALAFNAAGYHAVVLYYSLRQLFPESLKDISDTVCIIRDNADKWNVDSDKVIVCGFSAGGHLAAHYSNAYGTDNVRKVFPNSKKPNFSVLCYPVITADPTFAHKGSIENLLGEYPVGKETDEFSCEKLVTADTPPTFIWHTAQDTAVPPKNSLCYAMALSENNIPFSLHIYPYGCHGLATVDSLTNGELDRKTLLANEWFYELKKWMDNTI